MTPSPSMQASSVVLYPDLLLVSDADVKGLKPGAELELHIKSD